MNNEIESQLEKVSVTEPTETEKGIMWRKIEKTVTAPESRTYWEKITSDFSLFRLNAKVAFSLIVTILFCSTGVAFAYADTAKPGDALFPMSVFKEKVVIALAPTKDQDTLRLQYAQKRIEQGTEFFKTFNAESLTSTSTRMLADAISTSTTGTKIENYKNGKATSSPAVVNDAVNRLSATIAYLQSLKADFVSSGKVAAATNIQTAIDKILAQVSLASTNSATITAKVREHKNQFNVVVETQNLGTTTTTNLKLNTKKDTQKITVTEKNTIATPTKPKSTTTPPQRIRVKTKNDDNKEFRNSTTSTTTKPIINTNHRETERENDD